MGGSRRAENHFLQVLSSRGSLEPLLLQSDNYSGLTEDQKSMLLPPSAFGPAPEVRQIWAKAQAEHRELQELKKTQ